MKKIKTSDGYYIYDTNSNQIIEVKKCLYDLVSSVGKLEKHELLKKFSSDYTADEINDSIKEIEQAMQMGYLSSFRPSEMTFGVCSIDSAKKTIGENMQCLVLELTERCNNLCKYCQVSGFYSSNGKNGKARSDMNFSIARKAIDFFVKHNGKEKYPGLVFYGGEPLLKFDLLKKCLDYCREKLGNRGVSTSLTTNGRIMSARILEYAVNNNVHISISLDGPQEIHDRYRESADGKGTFENVVNTIEFIKKNKPDYYRNNVSINCVLSPPYYLEKVESFFKGELFDGIKNRRDGIRYSFVEENGNDFVKNLDLSDNGSTVKRELLSNLYEQFGDSMAKNQPGESSIAQSIVGPGIRSIAERHFFPLKRISRSFSNCYIGRRKLFVSTEGDFFMCEKAKNNYCFGNVNEGIDYRKILNFYKMLDRQAQTCKDCWAQRLCNVCFAVIGEKGAVSDEKFLKSCAGNLESAETRLRYFCRILEDSPSAFL